MDDISDKLRSKREEEATIRARELRFLIEAHHTCSQCGKRKAAGTCRLCLPKSRLDPGMDARRKVSQKARHSIMWLNSNVSQTYNRPGFEFAPGSWLAPVFERLVSKNGAGQVVLDARDL